MLRHSHSAGTALWVQQLPSWGAALCCCPQPFQKNIQIENAKDASAAQVQLEKATVDQSSLCCCTRAHPLLRFAGGPDGTPAKELWRLAEVVEVMRERYCGTLALEYKHLFQQVCGYGGLRAQGLGFGCWLGFSVKV